MFLAPPLYLRFIFLPPFFCHFVPFAAGVASNRSGKKYRSSDALTSAQPFSAFCFVLCPVGNQNCTKLHLVGRFHFTEPLQTKDFRARIAPWHCSPIRQAAGKTRTRRMRPKNPNPIESVNIFQRRRRPRPKEDFNRELTRINANRKIPHSRSLARV